MPCNDVGLFMSSANIRLIFPADSLKCRSYRIMNSHSNSFTVILLLCSYILEEKRKYKTHHNPPPPKKKPKQNTNHLSF